MILEVGKFYKMQTGPNIYILDCVETKCHGKRLIAEAIFQTTFAVDAAFIENQGLRNPTVDSKPFSSLIMLTPDFDYTDTVVEITEEEFYLKKELPIK